LPVIGGTLGQSGMSEAPGMKLRIESLSDLVFGLALSIGSLTLIGRIPPTPQALVYNILEFGFSFLILVGLWSGYTSLVSFLPVETTLAFNLNLALLFCVSIEPFLFYILEAERTYIGFASATYAVDIGSMYLILSSLVYIVLQKGRSRKGDKEDTPGFLGMKIRMYVLFVVGSIFLISAAPIFWVPVIIGLYLRFDLWYASWTIFISGRFIVRRFRRERS